MIKLDLTMLSADSSARLKKFGYAATRYYRAPRKKKFIKMGDVPVPVKRIYPRSIEMDYHETKQALVDCQDPEIRQIMDQIDITKFFERFETETNKVQKAEYKKLQALERELVQFANKLK